MPNAFTKIISERLVLIPVKVNEIDAVALVDTGATVSCVSRKIAMRARLAQKRETHLQSAHIKSISVPTYTADVSIPGNISFKKVRLAEFVGGGNFDVLIGMDIMGISKNSYKQCF